MEYKSHLSDDSPLSLWRLPLVAWIVLGLAMCFGIGVALMIWVAATIMPPLIKPPVPKAGLSAVKPLATAKIAPLPVLAQPSK